MKRLLCSALFSLGCGDRDFVIRRDAPRSYGDLANLQASLPTVFCSNSDDPSFSLHFNSHALRLSLFKYLSRSGLFEGRFSGLQEALS